MKKTRIFIQKGLRSPIGKKGGIWKKTIPEEFTAPLVQELARFHSPDDLLLATSLGTGGNMARYVALKADLPVQVLATTLDGQCAGAVKALQIGMAQIIAGQSSCVFVGGMESNSLAPFRNYQKNDPRYDASIPQYEIAQFAPPALHVSLLDAAAKLAEELSITPQEMSDWAYQSHQKAIQSLENEQLKNCVFPVNGVYFDETLPSHRSYEKWKSLVSRQLQTINATNTAHKQDGACVLVLKSVSEENLASVKDICEVVAVRYVAVEPARAPIAFLEAVEKLLMENDLTVSDIDCWEINESFALKPLAFQKKYQVNPKKINIFGGNLAYGHPFGASGAIGVLHLTQALQVTCGKWGVFAMSAAGGLGAAVLLRYYK
ncbi:MAG: thiolase family protein [Spirosomataceae bacterium]